jgi:integrase/recombinase XerD
MQTLITRYQRDLALKGYRPRTCTHYLSNVKQFLAYCPRDKDPDDPELIKDYLYHLIRDKKASDSKIRQAHSAIRYLVIQTLSRPWRAGAIPIVKKKKTLPVVYSVDEVFQILDHAMNLKHRTILTLIYSSGLRVSELVNLQLTDIKRDRKRLLIRNGKGAKDRYTILSDTALILLEEYWKAYHPAHWLFYGRKGRPLTVRACQHAFHLAKEKAGIGKSGGIHTLRHSFATHFLESGGGIFQLQQFLGHKKLKTTLVYAHVREENIKAVSPLDFYSHVRRHG